MSKINCSFFFCTERSLLKVCLGGLGVSGAQENSSHRGIPGFPSWKLCQQDQDYVRRDKGKEEKSNF